MNLTVKSDNTNNMIIPVRCFTCGKVIAGKWEPWKEMVEAGQNKTDAFAKLGMKRYCCKRMFLGHVDLIDKVNLYSENDNKQSDKTDKKSEGKI